VRPEEFTGLLRLVYDDLSAASGRDFMLMILSSRFDVYLRPASLAVRSAARRSYQLAIRSLIFSRAVSPTPLIFRGGVCLHPFLKRLPVADAVGLQLVQHRAFDARSLSASPY
jgi:hypothetical protein